MGSIRKAYSSRRQLTRCGREHYPIDTAVCSRDTDSTVHETSMLGRPAVQITVTCDFTSAKILGSCGRRHSLARLSALSVSAETRDLSFDNPQGPRSEGHTHWLWHIYNYKTEYSIRRVYFFRCAAPRRSRTRPGTPGQRHGPTRGVRPCAWRARSCVAARRCDDAHALATRLPLPAAQPGRWHSSLWLCYSNLT